MNTESEKQRNKTVGEEKYFEKKPLNMKSMVIGFFLLVIAAFLVLVRRDGLQVFKGKATTPEGIMHESVLEFLEDNNGTFIELLKFFGENEKESGALISRTLDLAYDNGESREIDLSLSKDGTLLTDNSKIAVFDLFPDDFAFSEFDNSGAVKTGTLDKLLSGYESIFLGVLSGCCTGMDESCMNKIDEILLYERRISFDISAQKLCEAYDSVISEAKTDKKLKKVFEKTYVGNKTYDDWLSDLNRTLKERALSANGDLYVDNTGALTMVCINATYLKDGAEHTCYIKMGYALMTGRIEYTAELVLDGETTFEISGKGNYDSKAQKISVRGVFGLGQLPYSNYCLDEVYRVNDRFLFGGNITVEGGNPEDDGGRSVWILKLAHRDQVQSIIFNHGTQTLKDGNTVIENKSGTLTIR